jgi:hypothetical protein
MHQRFEFIDLIVAVGLCATIVASGVLLMAANGMQIRTVGWRSIAQPTGNLSGMDLLQPVLGQANFTRRGVRSGLWSSVERAAHDNPRMIGKTEAMGQKMENPFLANTLTGSQEGGVTSERLTADRVAVLSAQDALPRISTTTTFIVASLILISLFTTGLFVFSPRRAGIPQTDPVHRGPAVLVPSKLL